MICIVAPEKNSDNAALQMRFWNAARELTGNSGLNGTSTVLFQWFGKELE